MPKLVGVLFFFCFTAFLSLNGQSDLNSAFNCEKKLEQAESELHHEEFSKLRKSISALTEHGSTLSPDCELRFLMLQGKYHYNDGNASLAAVYFEDAKSLSNQNSISEYLTESSYYLALAKIDDNKKEKAAEVLDEIIADKNQLLESDLAYEILDTRSMLHSSKGAHEEAMECLKGALSFISSTGNEAALKTQILNQVATNYQTLGKVDSSIFYYEKLIALKTETKDIQGLLSDYSTVGGLYKEMGSYEEAQKYFMNAIKKGEEIKDTLSLLTTYIDIAKVYMEQRLIDPALEYTEKAASLSKEKKALLIEGQSYQLKGSILESADQKDRALFFYNKALDVFEKLGLKQNIADIHLVTAGLFGNEDNLDKAELALNKALEIRLESRDKTGELNTKLALCDVLLKLDKDSGKVKVWLEDCFKIAKATNNKSAIQEYYYLQSTLDEKLGQFTSALSNYKKHNHVRDSISNQKIAKEVRSLEKLYETAKKDKEIALQQKQIAEQQGALKKRNTQIVQLLSGLLVLIILSFLTFITYQRNKVFNEQKLSVVEKEKEAQILRAMVSGEEQERRRIARDLHDGLGANLATVKMRISALRNTIPGIQDADSYNKAEELIDAACDNVREISHDMMPGSLSKYGLEVALEDMCDAIQKSNEIDVSFIPFGLDKIVDEVSEINIYRIVQELLKNVIKHAEAKEVIVQLSLEDDLLHIVVEDDGKGFDMERLNIFEGIGIGSIQSRVIYLNGKMDIDSQTNKGCTVNIEIPISTNQKKKLWSKS